MNRTTATIQLPAGSAWCSPKEKTHSSFLFLTQPKQAFTEMQINKLETTKKINMIDMKCEMVKKGKHKYTLTEKGTSNLTDDTK